MAKKILVVRVGCVGDVVMITAALKAILNYDNTAEVHLVTSPDGKRVLNGFDSRITKQIIYNRKAILAPIHKLLIRKSILKEDYDHIFNFEMKPSFMRLFIGSKSAIHIINDYTPDKNYAWHCLQTVNRAYNQGQNGWVNLPVQPQAGQQAQQVFEQYGIGKTDIVIGLHPSFSGLKKTSWRNMRSRHERGWPVESWAVLARQLHDYATEQGLTVRIIMDLLEGDRELGESIVNRSDGKTILMIPPMNFERYKATLQRMDVLVTPNTGPMHIAGAVGTRMVALFAGESPDNCGPYIADEQYIPLCAEDVSGSEQGLAAIPVEKVLAACKLYLKV